MATLNIEALHAAHRDGLIQKRLSKREQQYLNPSVTTANRIYWAIAQAGSDGLDSNQLEKRLGIARNTLFQYLRWLESVGLMTKLSRSGEKGLYIAG